MNWFNVEATQLAFWGITIHLVVDWIFQNEWMALNKANLKHPAAYVHAGLHLAGLLLVFPFNWALTIAIWHLYVDTRIPLKWWRRVYKQTTVGDMATHVAIWQDQVMHWLIICIHALLMAHTQ